MDYMLFANFIKNSSWTKKFGGNRAESTTFKTFIKFRRKLFL